MRIFKKRDRRSPKNAILRQLINENEVIADEVREMAKKLTITINGDQDWLRKQLLKNKEKTDGHRGAALLSDINCP